MIQERLAFGFIARETIVDREALDRGEFQAQGGFSRLNKIFDGKLQELLQELTETIWKTAA